MKTTAPELRAIVEASTGQQRQMPVLARSRLSRSVGWVAAAVIAATAVYFVAGLVGILTH